MTVLIIAEHQHQELSPATLNAVTAACQLGDVDILVAGEEVTNVVQQAREITGVKRVLQAEAAHYAHALAEELTPLVLSLAADYDYIVAAATAAGKNVMPRIAALLDCAQISDVTQIVDQHTFVHPIYAGNAFQTVKNLGGKLVLTIRTTAFDAAPAQGGNADVMIVATTPAQQLSRFISRELTQSERPELTEARVVVSGGRGLGSAEQFNAVLLPLAEQLQAAVGASRAAVDAGYAPNDYQVGQTGKIVAPQLYIAVAISGAIQHLAGMKDSQTIVAINKDPDAPIFNVADYGLVADLNTAIPQLVAELQKIAH
ncbi:FAD-binding protein [Neisseriaceae bacterium ESL0693]|nr:FAD-binding protein [Neisseriaceae bacterium ESL0693]